MLNQIHQKLDTLVAFARRDENGKTCFVKRKNVLRRDVCWDNVIGKKRKYEVAEIFPRFQQTCFSKGFQHVLFSFSVELNIKMKHSPPKNAIIL